MSKVPSADIKRLLMGSAGSLRLFLLKEFTWMMPKDTESQYKICDEIIRKLRKNL